MNRREVIVGAGALAAATALPMRALAADSFVSKRPPVSARRFVSKAVETEIKAVKAKIADPEIAWLFENCYPNTLDTTVAQLGTFDGKPDAVVITGDINALW